MFGRVAGRTAKAIHDVVPEQIAELKAQRSGRLHYCGQALSRSPMT
jgi:hypothetical protein